MKISERKAPKRQGYYVGRNNRILEFHWCYHQKLQGEEITLKEILKKAMGCQAKIKTVDAKKICYILDLQRRCTHQDKTYLKHLEGSLGRITHEMEVLGRPQNWAIQEFGQLIDHEQKFALRPKTPAQPRLLKPRAPLCTKL